jgi:hypothetical protein
LVASFSSQSIGFFLKSGLPIRNLLPQHTCARHGR